MTKPNKTGPKTASDGPRKKLLTKPYISATNYRKLGLWRSLYGVPAGRIIDAAMEFASSHRDFKLPTKGRKLNHNQTIKESNG
jgi:hypothetical protein